MANPFQPDRVEDATIRRNFDRLQTLLARYEKAVGGFRAYRNAAQSRTTGQVVEFDTESFDYSGWFDVTTNVGRFTPLIAGIYDFSWAVQAGVAITADQFWVALLRKNGTACSTGSITFQRGTAGVRSVGSDRQVANGTTDYFDVEIVHNTGASTALSATSAGTYFSGHYVGGKP
jgi:hypothetical protein